MSLWGLLMAGHIKPKKMLDFNKETLNFSLLMGYL
jgi:hypothetical protein